MGIVRFERWCARAAGGVRIRADRQAVIDELYAHMEDQYEELLAAGYTERAAEEEVLAAMGDAGETARQLERVHRPTWAYALRAARWCLALAALLALLLLPGYIRDLAAVINAGPAAESFCFGESREEELSFDRRVFYTETGSRDGSDGYTFTLLRAAERSYGSIAEPEDVQSVLYLEVRVFNPRPWADPCTGWMDFYAADSLGNVYPSSLYANRRPYIAGTWSRTGLFTYTWIAALHGYCSQEAEWVELRYEKSGRDLRLPVDLRGRGEGAP